MIVYDTYKEMSHLTKEQNCQKYMLTVFLITVGTTMGATNILRLPLAMLLALSICNKKRKTVI